LGRQCDSYAEFLDEVKPRLRYALVARYGAERGLDALSDTPLYGLRHWDRLSGLRNPAGYLYRVGRRLAWRRPEPIPRYEPRSDPRIPWVQPELTAALASLSPRQREMVVVVGAFEYTHAEAAETLRVSRSSVQTHYKRGMERLREALEADWEALLPLYTPEEIDRIRAGEEGYAGGFHLWIAVDGTWSGAAIMSV